MRIRFIIGIFIGLQFLYAFKVFAGCELDPGFKSFNKTAFKGNPATPKNPAKGLKYYTSEEIKKIIKSSDKNKYVMIDTRPESLHKQCKIKGSVNHPFTYKGHAGAIMNKAIVAGYISSGKTVIFYCNALRCYRSVNAALQSVCEWGLPADKVGWYGKGVPGLAKIYKRGVKGSNCSQFY